MRRCRLLLLTAAGLLCACGGGGGGGGGPPGPPPPPFSRIVELGLAVAANFSLSAALDPFVLLPVSEIETGADLNADGDMVDDVIHELDLRNDTVRNLGLALLGAIVTSDAHFAFLVNEGGTVAGDLNGDGDGNDSVWHVYDPNQAIGPGNPLNTLAAAPATGLAGAGTAGGFVLLQSESASGVDLNGDTDTGDVMGAVFDGQAFALAGFLVGPYAATTPLPARNGRVAFASSEANAAADLNGDGDMTDVVIGAVDFNGAGPPVFNPAGLTARAISTHPFALTDNELVYFIDEATNAVGPVGDRNNDGDTADAVLAIFDLGGLTGEVLPFSAAVPSFGLACSPAVGIGAGANRILVGVDEAAQGGTDINGDMLANDIVLAWVDTAGAPATANILANLTLAAIPPRIDGTRGIVFVSEAAQLALNGIDLNGDGDDTDNVAFAVDTAIAPGFSTNLMLAITTIRLNGLDALLGVSEQQHFNADRNGNGVIGDVVESYFDLGDIPPGARGLGLIVNDVEIFRVSATKVRLAAVIPEGQSGTFDDINADGDSTDVVFEFVEVNPDASPPQLIAPTPVLAATASLVPGPPLRANADTYLCATSEVMEGADLNGDGDEFDTVVRIVRIEPPPP